MLFGLKETTTRFQLEPGVILHSPRSTHRLLQISLALPNLISYRIGDAGRHQRAIHTHIHVSHIIRSAFEPSGFYGARLENGAIKAMSEASAPFLLPTLLSAPPVTK